MELFQPVRMMASIHPVPAKCQMPVPALDSTQEEDFGLPRPLCAWLSSPVCPVQGTNGASKQEASPISGATFLLPSGRGSSHGFGSPSPEPSHLFNGKKNGFTRLGSRPPGHWGLWQHLQGNSGTQAIWGLPFSGC